MMATTSNGLSARSVATLKKSRPMRPIPLIPTRTRMSAPRLIVIDGPGNHRRASDAPARDGRHERRRTIVPSTHGSPSAGELRDLRLLVGGQATLGARRIRVCAAPRPATRQAGCTEPEDRQRRHRCRHQTRFDVTQIDGSSRGGSSRRFTATRRSSTRMTRPSRTRMSSRTRASTMVTTPGGRFQDVRSSGRPAPVGGASSCTRRSVTG